MSDLNPPSFYAELDDHALMDLVSLKDDPAAFAVLVERYQNILLNFFLRSGVKYDAEDLAQQTFLRLYKYRKKYTHAAQFKTFLFLMGRQVWIDEIRRQDRAQRLSQKLMEDPPENLLREEVSPADHTAGRVDLAEALQELTEPLRQVIELGVYQDLPYTDVARILKIPVGTVKSRMFHALAKLREVFERKGIQK